MRGTVLVVAALVAALLTFAAACGDDESADEVNQSTFDEAFADLEATISLAEQGDVDAAQSRFNEMHNFTHRLDSELRRNDEPELAREAFDAVVAIEETLAGDRDAAQLVERSTRLLVLLTRAASALGYAAPGE